METKTSWKALAYYLCLFLVIFFFCIFTTTFITKYKELRQREPTNDKRELLHSWNKQRSPSGRHLVRVDLIKDWMTFSYINRTFDLPDTYLQTTLSVTNPGYPNITISKASKESNSTIDAYLEHVKGAVHQYLNSAAQ